MYRKNSIMEILVHIRISTGLIPYAYYLSSILYIESKICSQLTFAAECTMQLTNKIARCNIMP